MGSDVGLDEDGLDEDGTVEGLALGVELVGKPEMYADGRELGIPVGSEDGIPDGLYVSGLVPDKSLDKLIALISF